MGEVNDGDSSKIGQIMTGSLLEKIEKEYHEENGRYSS